MSVDDFCSSKGTTSYKAGRSLKPILRQEHDSQKKKQKTSSTP